MTANANSGAKEIKQIAHELLKLSERLTENLQAAGAMVPTEHPINLLSRAEGIYRARRQRERFFHDSLFGEPAWDIMLDLFIQGERGQSVSVSSACIGSGVPTTTALRWIQALMSKELLRRTPDENDARRINVTLSEKGRSLMAQFIRSTYK